MQRQLLEPVGTESVADVVRKLGAVLAMDEGAAGLSRTDRGSVALVDRAAGLSPAGAGQVASASSTKAAGSRRWAGSSVAMS